MKQERHDAYHLGERDYAEDIWMKSEHTPSRITAMSMDAPTETQFDVPVQMRTSYDPVKSLDTAKNLQKLLRRKVARLSHAQTRQSLENLQ